MRVPFTKMHALGNDFIVLEAAAARGLSLSAAQWQALADRHRGIGFDQAVVLEAPRRDDTLAFYRIYNADGSEAEQSGNGVRCLAELLRLQGRAHDGRLQLERPGGLVKAVWREPGMVAVDMGEPDFATTAVGFDAAGQAGPHYSLGVLQQQLEFSIASMGNPHAVIEVPSVGAAAVSTIGAALESHPRFARRVNVGFRQVVDRSHIRLRVFERGAGETQACGSGACAAVATGIRDGMLDPRVQIDLPGGSLTVEWQGPATNLWLEGPAQVSFTGQFEI
ncbi:MAG: diaminopimelate epimerase [Pseudomonadota bacterium]